MATRGLCGWSRVLTAEDSLHIPFELQAKSVKMEAHLPATVQLRDPCENLAKACLINKAVAQFVNMIKEIKQRK